MKFKILLLCILFFGCVKPHEINRGVIIGKHYVPCEEYMQTIIIPINGMMMTIVPQETEERYILFVRGIVNDTFHIELFDVSASDYESAIVGDSIHFKKEN